MHRILCICCIYIVRGIAVRGIPADWKYGLRAACEGDSQAPLSRNNRNRETAQLRTTYRAMNIGEYMQRIEGRAAVLGRTINRQPNVSNSRATRRRHAGGRIRRGLPWDPAKPMWGLPQAALMQTSQGPSTRARSIHFLQARASQMPVESRPVIHLEYTA